MSSIIYNSQNNEENVAELESFCSSCNSALNTIWSLGTASSLEEISGELSEETNNLNAYLHATDNNLKLQTNHFAIKNNIGNSSLMIDEKRRINDEINLPIHKKIKCSYQSQDLSQPECIQSKCLDNKVIPQCKKNDTIQGTKIEETNGNNIHRHIRESEDDCTKPIEISHKTLMLNKSISENNMIADHKVLDICLQEKVKVPTMKQIGLNIDDNTLITNSSPAAHSHKNPKNVQNNTINCRKNILRITNRLLNLSLHINGIKDAINRENGQMQKSDMSNNLAPQK